MSKLLSTITCLNPPTHRVMACRAFLFGQDVPSSCLTCFLLSFRTSAPYPLLATSPRKFQTPGRPRNLLCSMTVSASMFDNILVTFWTPEAPKLKPKTTQNGFTNLSQNVAKWIITSKTHENTIRKRASKTTLPWEAVRIYPIRLIPKR